jgi:O-antigen ligase
LKNTFLRWGVWAIVPLGWHAIFLTGSRGGLVGVGATLLVSVLRSKTKFLSLLLIPAFVIAFLWQGGDVMQNRAGTISEYEMDRSATGRLEAWSAATSMVGRHPVTGVGLSSFVPAFPYFSDDNPREAHNTFFQIAGESGLISGLMYLLVVYACLIALWRNHNRISRMPASADRETLFWVNEATLIGYVGLFVCSLFLSLHVFEIFYLMCALVNALLFSIVAMENSEPRKERQKVRV